MGEVGKKGACRKYAITWDFSRMENGSLKRNALEFEWGVWQNKREKEREIQENKT